jgi:hypothetical protein
MTVTKLNWERVQVENRIIKNGSTAAYDALYPCEQVMRRDSKKITATKTPVPKVSNSRKLPDFLKVKSVAIDQSKLHDFLCEELYLMQKHNNWSKLFQTLCVLPPKSRVRVAAWVQRYSPWVLQSKNNRPIKFTKNKFSNYNLEDAGANPYWAEDFFKTDTKTNVNLADEEKINQITEIRKITNSYFKSFIEDPSETNFNFLVEKLTNYKITYKLIKSSSKHVPA